MYVVKHSSYKQINMSSIQLFSEMVKVFQLTFYKNNKFSDIEILAEVIEAWHWIIEVEINILNINSKYKKCK